MSYLDSGGGVAFGVGFCLDCGLGLCFLIVVLGFGVESGSFEGGFNCLGFSACVWASFV